jgi:hypothetical protein
MSTFNFVSVGGQPLRPAPYVSTSYEYNKFGEYTIGGVLIVTLSGTLVGEDILSQMNSLGQQQMNTNCVEVVIGCSGGSDFLKGSGRIRSIDISPSDQPFLASYSMQIAVETINGEPAVVPDEDFLRNNCLSNIKYLQSYNETISVQGEGNSLGSSDPTLGLSKSYVKASGQISVSSFGREICGVPEFKGIEESLKILRQRASALLSLTPCGDGNPFASFSGWQKWLDSKRLDIDTGTGTVTWSFDVYMSNGGCSPSAWADITTEDRFDPKKNTRTKIISGTIKGLSSSTGDFLGNKASANERIGNADAAFNKIVGIITQGSWPSSAVVISGTLGTCIPPDPCGDNQSQFCYQRISSNLTKSVVSGEITFSAEFGDISKCKRNAGGIGTVDVSVEVSYPADRIVEIIVPNGVNAIVQKVGDTPARGTITGRGTLSGCDKTKINQLIGCVQTELNKKLGLFNGWILLKQKKSVGTYSYSETREYIQCG